MRPDPGSTSPSSLLPLPARPALPERAGGETAAAPDANGGDETASGASSRWLTAVEWFGRAALTLGILAGLFVAHQIWGTRLVQAREQDALRSQFDEQLAAGPDGSAGEVGRAPAAAPVELGGDPSRDALALIEIPSLKLETVAVEGIGADDLRKGPGHYPGTALPGEVGNAAFAGHRVTYGAPFHGLDHLEAGDEIVVTTVRGRFIYLVKDQRIVPPDEVSVLDPTPDPRLTLTTCHPKLSARERLVVVATLFGEPLPPSAARGSQAGSPGMAADVSRIDGSRAGLGGLDAGFGLWAAATVAVGGAWWWAFRRRRGPLVWFAGAVPFVGVLFFFFAQVEGLIPATF